MRNASLFCPLSPSPSIKMIKKEGELASYSRSLPSLPRSLSPMLKKGLEPNYSQHFEARLSPLHKSSPISLGEDGDKE